VGRHADGSDLAWRQRAAFSAAPLVVRALAATIWSGEWRLAMVKMPMLCPAAQAASASSVRPITAPSSRLLPACLGLPTALPDRRTQIP
jgi:hypothetical protein